MDNYGYSSNNSGMNQGAENNLYPDSSKQEQHQTKGMFLAGMLTGIVISVLVAGSVYAGVKVADILHLRGSKQTSAEGASAQNVVNNDSITKLESIEKVIDEYYYNEEDIDTDNMIEGMYAGMVDSLGDPYSVYYTQEEWEELMRDTEGVYYGIGAYVSLDSKTGCGKISGVIENTPAQEAGLRENDIIYLVDGEPAQGLELSEIVAMIKGEEGTTVHLTIYREGEEDYLEMDVVRKQIESPTVKYEMKDNGIGYIQITEFDEVTYDQFVEALSVIKGNEAKGLILDLRTLDHWILLNYKGIEKFK